MGTPLSLSLTEFHFILLYKDRILGICSLDDRLAYEESLPIVRHFVPILSMFMLTVGSET